MGLDKILESYSNVQITTESAHADFLRTAYEIAWNSSQDEKTKVGAVIVSSDGKSIFSDANRFPPGVLNTPARQERPRKYSFIEHAERNIILRVADKTIFPGSTFYSPWLPCADCTRAILINNIPKVVIHGTILEKDGDRWMDSHTASLEMFSEAGTQILVYQGKIGGVKSLFSEQIWEP